MISKKLRLLVLKIKKLLLRKPFVKSSRERKLWLQRRLVPAKVLESTKILNKKLKTKLLKKLKRKLFPRRNDLSSYLNH